MAIPGIGGCFRCRGRDHWADNCPELTPPASKAEYDARLSKYMEWKWECRVTLSEGRALIENLNKMWRGDAPKGARK